VQTANIPTWFTNNYLSFKIPSNYITQSFKAGFLVQAQTLASDLSAVQLNNSSNLVSDSSLEPFKLVEEKGLYRGRLRLAGKNPENNPKPAA